MAKLGPYQVLVRDLPTHRTLEVGPDRVGEWLRGLPMRDALGAPDGDPQAGQGTADLELYLDGSHVFANGSFAGFLTVACSRCVEPVRMDLAEQLRITFMPKSEMPAETDDADAEEGLEVGAEDLDLFPYDGEVVDLEPLLREQFVLAVPYAPLCREDCKGLCPQCGIDRNSASCNCEKPGDPRLLALKGLKLPS
ncbi:MAG: DUF177 domain-containing protein [Myxococcota bacterium]|nr:DUF177 domain-containing protein [Myxococcota bacterium]